MLKINEMSTEQENPNSANFSSMPILEAIELMNREDQQVINCVHEQLEQIAKVIEQSSKTLQDGGRIIYVGAGTSGRLGLLDAVECPPTFGVDYDMVIGLIAGGENAFVKAKEGAEDSESEGAADLKALQLTEHDMVIGIAASGRTPFVIGALKYAIEKNVTVAAIVCNPDSPISKICPLMITLEPGPEVLTGSTRLKAGTATKMVLNMISTVSMIRIGKVYKNYMVDLKPSNEKLVARAIGIIQRVTHCSREVAEENLELAENNCKVAIVMILRGLDKAGAEAFLEANQGKIDSIVEGI